MFVKNKQDAKCVGEESHADCNEMKLERARVCLRNKIYETHPLFNSLYVQFGLVSLRKWRDVEIPRAFAARRPIIKFTAYKDAARGSFASVAKNQCVTLSKSHGTKFERVRTSSCPGEST